jgi:nitroimidazol reductase NimA-like FMN-containing flavoprotein (pyridoxamine 5'-phosphate oxidase superfamily)
MTDDVAEKEDRMALTMTKRERETFLAGVHVGMISSAEEGRGPLTVPLWYAYTPAGEVRLITGRHSRKGRLLTQAGRCSLCVQTESPPYRYVSVEGPSTAIEPVDVERDLRPLAHRYLGVEEGESFVERTRGRQAENILIRMRPERWLTADYSKESV